MFRISIPETGLTVTTTPSKLAAATIPSRDNNFNLLRFLAAAAVIVTHSFVLAGAYELRPLYRLTGYWDEGEMGVNIFFVISGYLVTQSFIQRRDLWAFLEARFLRIFPALFVLLLLTVFIIGPLATSLPLVAYFFDWDTYRYFFQNLTLVEIEQRLPGVFLTNPVKRVVNNSLWTLPWEIRCYIGLAMLGTLFILPRPKALKLAVMVALVAFFFWPLLSWFDGIKTMAPIRLAAYFALGMFFYLMRDRLPLGPAGMFVLSVAMLLSFLTHELVQVAVAGIFLAYLVLWVALDRHLCWRAFNRVGDYSYGLYIYAYPIQQTIVAYNTDISPWHLFFLSFALTLPCAILSWHFLERRALDLKGKVDISSLARRPSRWELAPVGIEQVELRGRLLRVNQKLCQMLGYTQSELEKLSFRDITHPVDLDEEERLLSNLITGKIRSYSIRKRYLHKNGAEVPVRVISSQVRKKDGGGYRISIIVDVSQEEIVYQQLFKADTRVTRTLRERFMLPLDRWAGLNEAIARAVEECAAYRRRAARGDIEIAKC